MAPLPKTALLESRLNKLTAGPAVPESGHVVIQVQFVDFDGQSKKAFYKRLDPSYPKILAMMSVATSVIMRSLLGERAAEDRLVYDDKGEVVGTLSIAIEGFKPFNFGSENVPEDPQEKERVLPSYKTLMQHNIIELLFFSWFLGDDDLHPKNMGLNGRIDYDMFFYNITQIIKGPRPVGGGTSSHLNITANDFFNFPVLTDSAPTHWPTRQIPDNYYYPKRYSNYDQFIALAGNPTYLDPVTGNTTTAQKQLFTAVLKALLTYQPDLLKKRLKDALGKEPLNYKALSSQQQTQLETAYPGLFNSRNNSLPFVEFMANLYQNYYDELYRKLVFSQGCDANASGVAVPAFNKFIHDHPSLFRGIKKWADAQNHLLNEQQTLCRAHMSRKMVDNTDTNIACAEPLEKAIKAVSDSRKLNKDDLLRRYHQVWRDSFTLQIKSILKNSKKLSQDLQTKLSLSNITDDQFSETNHEDPGITEASQILTGFQVDSPETVQGRLDCGKDNDLRHGLLELIKVHDQLDKVTMDYFHKQIKHISNIDNNQYIAELQKIRDAYLNIIGLLGESTSWGKDCANIVCELSRFCGSALFASHLFEQDETIQTMIPVRAITRPHTDKDVVEDCLTALFNWVTKLPPDTLSEKIITVLETEYVGGMFRYREQPVRTFLMQSRGVSGDDRLAYILASGDSIQGSLNTILVEKLIREMVYSTQSDINVFLPSIRAAIEEHTFNLAFYTQKAYEYAMNNERFHHLLSKNAIPKVNQVMYEWVSKISTSQFKGYINLALANYSKGKTWLGFSSGSRTAEIEGYFKQWDSNPRILAAIFRQGGLKSTSFNPRLFEILINAMKRDIIGDDEKLRQNKYKRILQIVEKKEIEHFVKTIQPYAKTVDVSAFEESASASGKLTA